MFNLNRRISFFVRLLVVATTIASTTAQANLLEDPTRPSNIKKPTPAIKSIEKKALIKREEKLLLSAITFSPHVALRSAIINDLWVKKGSKINGATVISIENNAVELSRAGKIVTVRLIPQIKTIPESQL